MQCGFYTYIKGKSMKKEPEWNNKGNEDMLYFVANERKETPP